MSTTKSNILRQSYSFQLQVCSSMGDFLVDTRRLRIKSISPNTHVVSTSVRRRTMSYEVVPTLKQRCVPVGLNLHQRFSLINADDYTARKVSKYGVFSGPYSVRIQENTDQKKLRIWMDTFHAEIYGVNLRIQLEYRKTRTRKNSVFGHFSRSAIYLTMTIFR